MLDVITIPEDAFDRIVEAAQGGSWSNRAVTVLDGDHNQTDTIVPGKHAWIVAEDPYEATVLFIAPDGKVSKVESE